MAISKTSKARHKRFLEAGYLPDELPPTFSSKQLAANRDAVLNELSKIPALKNGEPWFYRYQSSPAPVYFPRFGKQDRKHYVLNPINFLFLSKEISESWNDIRRLLKKSPISASQPIFDWSADGRALLPIGFSERDKRTAQLSVRNSFLLKSDLARYFHSIYTHALAWAVHGKSTAKKNRTNALLGNRLDMLSRNAQDGQTIGLPVGPETSRILSEIVGVAIDRDLLAQLSLKPQDCLRFVDDFAFGVSSKEEAEKTLSLLRRTAHSYELEVNEEKTGIANVFNLEYASWRHEIKSIRPSFGADQSHFERFFDQLNELSNSRPQDNVLRYAIKASRALLVRSHAWASVEDFLLLAYRKNPSILPSAVEILVNRHKLKGDVDLKKVGHFIASNVRRLSETEKHGELIWLLFLASELRLKIKGSSLEGLFGLNCPLTALHICHLSSLGLISTSIDRSTWNLSLNSDGLKSEMWLYAYEATLKAWTGKSSSKFVSTDSAFGSLWKSKISFFDISAHVADVGVSSKKDMTLSLKLKSALSGGRSIFDFDDSVDDIDFEDQDDGDWSDY